VEHFRRLKWDTTRLHDASPFQVVDPGFNAILIRSCADLADLAEALGYTALAAENRSFADRGLAAMESLWSAQHGQYLCLDRVQDALIDSASVGGILAVFAAIPLARAAAIAGTSMASTPAFASPATPPKTPGMMASAIGGPRMARGQLHDRRRSGPGRTDRTCRPHRRLQSGPDPAKRLCRILRPADRRTPGGKSFTWTAAMVLEFLDREA